MIANGLQRTAAETFFAITSFGAVMEAIMLLLAVYGTTALGMFALPYSHKQL